MGRFEAETKPSLKKQEKKKSNMTWRSGQKPGCNSLTFVFFSKTIFFFKIKPGYLETRVGSKNYAKNHYNLINYKKIMN
jgi:hypothetical protein